MMQMLAAGGLRPLSDGVRGADGDNPEGYFELEAVKRTRTDASWLEQAPGHAVKMVHLLLLDLPARHGYRVIFMQRDLEEVLASQQAMLARKGDGTAQLPAERLAAVYRQQVAAVLRSLRGRSNFRLAEVRHRDCIETPAAAAAAINAFLGGGLDAAAAAAAVRPGLYRQRGAARAQGLTPGRLGATAQRDQSTRRRQG